VDFWLVRHKHWRVPDFYRGKGESIYWFTGGFNWRAFAAWTLAVWPSFRESLAVVHIDALSLTLHKLASSLQPVRSQYQSTGRDVSQSHGSSDSVEGLQSTMLSVFWHPLRADLTRLSIWTKLWVTILVEQVFRLRNRSRSGLHPVSRALGVLKSAEWIWFGVLVTLAQSLGSGARVPTGLRLSIR
jgi:hypothetical protein